MVRKASESESNLEHPRAKASKRFGDVRLASLGDDGQGPPDFKLSPFGELLEIFSSGLDP